jgi:class 3 adenylate cyclase
VGIDAGPALYQTGDYIGSAVNVASRVATAAMAGQILLTEPVATGQPRIRLQARARSGQFVRLDVPSTRGLRVSDEWPLDPFRTGAAGEFGQRTVSSGDKSVS